MSNQVFQQNLDDKKGPQPGGPYLIQILFKEPVDMPDKETMTAVIEKHIGSTECFCYDKQMAGFAAQEHSLAHSNHKRIHLCLCFYVSEW